MDTSPLEMPGTARSGLRLLSHGPQPPASATQPTGQPRGVKSRVLCPWMARPGSICRARPQRLSTRRLHRGKGFSQVTHGDFPWKTNTKFLQTWHMSFPPGKQSTETACLWLLSSNGTSCLGLSRTHRSTAARSPWPGRAGAATRDILLGSGPSPAWKAAPQGLC